MIVCEQCGTRNETGARFCGGCGEYLAWEGDTRVAEDPAAVATDEDAAVDDGLDASVDREAEEAAAVARREAEHAERERLKAEHAAEEARLEAARAAESERLERERHESERAAEEERLQAERLAAEMAELERLERERLAQEQREQRRRAEAAERARLAEEEEAAADRAERERLEAERLEAEQREAEQREAQRQEAARLEQERLEAERAEEAKQAAEARRAAEAKARAEEQRAAAAKKAAEAKRLAAAAMLRPVQPTSERPSAPSAAAASAPEGPTGSTEARPAMNESEPDVAAPRKPEARQPGRPGQRRTPPPPPEEDEEPPLQPGDLVCAQCGAGNVPTRKFCRRCGFSLQEAAVVPKAPWYRRIFKRKPKAPKPAGTRPVHTGRRGSRLAREVRRLVLLLLVLGALAAALWFFRDSLSRAVDYIRDRVVEPAPVTSTDQGASSHRRGHPPERTTDGAGNTYWLPAPTGEAIGEYLEYSFDEPIRLVAIQMIPGAEDDDQALFLSEGRPLEMRISATTSDEDVVDKTWTLRDEPGNQEIYPSIADVQSVRLIIADAELPSPEASVAVAEVRFFTRE